MKAKQQCNTVSVSAVESVYDCQKCRLDLGSTKEVKLYLSILLGRKFPFFCFLRNMWVTVSGECFFPLCQFKTHCSHSLSLGQTHYTVPDAERDLESLNATIECEQPQPDLYKYALIMWPQQIYTTRLWCMWFVGKWISLVLHNSDLWTFGKPLMFGWFLVEVGPVFAAILDLPNGTQFVLVHL